MLSSLAVIGYEPSFNEIVQFRSLTQPWADTGTS
jgi:hypothetical protein